MAFRWVVRGADEVGEWGEQFYTKAEAVAFARQEPTAERVICQEATNYDVIDLSEERWVSNE